MMIRLDWRAWMNRIFHCQVLALLALLAACLGGCQTIGTIKPINLSESGWRARQGQAVWRMPGNRPELAGEMTFAIHTNGECFVEFSKTPFTMVLAKCGTTRWEIEFPPQKLYFAGGGTPPKRLAWLHVCNGLAGKEVAPPWRFARHTDGSWRLDNARTKEAVEGFLEP